MENESIKRKAFSSAIWKFLERIIAQLVSLLVSIILARILMPQDYSVVSLVAIFFTFANVIISGGFNSALIQKRNADKDDYSTVFVLSVVAAFVIYLVMFVIAPQLTSIFNQPSLTCIIRVMGISLPITAVKSIWCAYISANLQFKKFFFSTIGGTLVSAIVGIFLAMAGFGPWALVAQQMTNTIIDTCILVITTRIGIRLSFSIEKFRDLFGYSWKVLVASIIGTIYSQLIPLVIGIKYSSADLAYYSKGKSFPELLSITSTNTLSAVLFPVLSKYQDSKESLLNYTRLFMRLSSYISFPLMLGMFAISENFISVLLTDKWLTAVPYLRIFCIAYLFEMIHIGNCETIKAMGRSDIFLKIEIIKKSAYFITISLFLFVSNSPIILATAFVMCTFIAVIVNSFPNRKLIGYCVKDQVLDLLPNLVNSIIMCICVSLLNYIAINKLILLAVQIVFGSFIYVLLSIVTRNMSFLYLVELLRDIRGRNNK